MGLPMSQVPIESPSSNTAGYESEVEEDATEVPAEEVVQERRPQRKEREPFDVPTSGAFWMHDDRMADDEFAASGYVHACCLDLHLAHGTIVGH